MSYTEIRDQSREEIRRALMDAASRLLAERGLSALTMRRVAAEIGCTTTVLYTLFGSKEGLIRALWVEGFDRLWEAEEAAAFGDPRQQLAGLAWTYRRNALDNPDYYRIMFGGAIPGFRPTPEMLERGHRTFQVLVDTVWSCMEAGILWRQDPQMVASVLWATVHGVISLQLSGSFGEREEQAIYEQALRAVFDGLRA